MKKFALAVAALALLATAGTAHAAMGVTSEFDGWVDPRIGINFGGNGTTIDVLAGFQSIDTDHNTIVLGGRFERLMTSTGNASPLFGLCADVELTSLDESVVNDAIGEKDSFTDISAGGFIGGRVEIVENFSIAGHMGLKVILNGKRYDDGDGTTNFGTFANWSIRWTGLWGN